jgi:hypothetical protein
LIPPLPCENISLAAPKKNAVDVEVEGQNMLGSASRLRGALWSWTREQAGIARQAATADRTSGRTIVRTILAVSLTSVVYAAFGTIVWSAYDQFGHQSPRDVTPRVVAGAAPVKLAPARLTVRDSEGDRPLVVEAFEPSVDDELPPQLATALLEDRDDDPREAPSLSTPARARSVARAASAVRPAVAPEDAGPEQAFARAEARLEARSDPSAGPFRHEPVASPEVLSAVRPSEGIDTPRPVASMSVESTSPRPSAVPAKPEATTPLPPLPWLKPADFAAAWASADRAFSSQGDGRTNAAAAGSGAGSRTPPQPAFKPLEAARILASGEPLRMATAAAEPESGLRSFWSNLMALFAPAPRRLLIAGNGGGREADFGRGVAERPGRAGGDPAARSPGNGSGGGSGTDGASTSGGNSAGDTTNGGSTGRNTGSADNSANRGSDQGRGGRDGDDDDDDDDDGDGGRGRGGGDDDDDGGRGGGDDDDGGRGRGGGDDDGGRGRGGGDDDGGGRGRGGGDDDGGSGGNGGGGKGGGGKGGGKGGGGDDD